ncbi:MAG: saccharopine dehydrogenase NADP-binding domain-containing protein [Actinomycetota bacterium]|nr:saccharopine dehydrogenase NADP-binding domain-containing protein [Actinomycetota bacterium]
MADRSYDVTLLGATGFTGGLTAAYLARRFPPGARWAIAGRSRQKLEAVRSGLTGPAHDVDVIEADVTDSASVQTLARETRVLITTVGPYLKYGEPAVAACAEAGTDYVDLTGEPEFVDSMWLRYHERARETGARLVHSCGFDSIPYDLGALFTVQQLPEGVPIALEGFVCADGKLSGGTVHSAITAMGRLRQGGRVARERRRREGRPSGRVVKGTRGAPHRNELAGGWVIPFPTIDPQTVLRSARALPRYGPKFTYSHYLVTGSFPVLAGMVAGASGVIALAQLPQTRNLLLKLRSPGEGPSLEQRATGWFKVKFSARGGPQAIVTEVSGGDPGYEETSKMLAESALCLAFDELPDTAGQVTPAVAMGDALIDRLRNAGIELRVKGQG